jgi:Baseplate J-like protein
MAASYPETDSRGVKELRAALEREAAVLVPALSQPPRPGEFGHAFYELAARMAAQLTSRLNKTAQRDEIAFFDALDIPPMAPRAAEAPVVFVLAEKRDAPVIARQGTQISAQDKTDDLVFETRAELMLTPARLSRVFAADAATDRIEAAPDGILSTAPRPGPFPAYQVATFAGMGSKIVQVTPTVGLQNGDVVRVAGDLVYRIAKIEHDLLTLDPGLGAPAAAGTAIEKVTRFDAFTLRNVQAHRVFIGHADLLKLDQPALITLLMEPPSVMRALGQMNITAQLWGTQKQTQDSSTASAVNDQAQPDWQALDLVAANENGLTFAKTWAGSVEKYEVDGQKSLWLRLVLNDPIANAAGIGTRVRHLTMKVATAPGSTADAGPTVTKAFHNNTPLATATSFLPFGPEPQRFDTFALAAPEALSKKGAQVTLGVDLVDASLMSLTAAGKDPHGPLCAYGIGENGRLQAITFDGSATKWQEIDHPEAPPSGSADAASLRLAASKPIQAIQIPGGTSVVFAYDSQVRLWAQNLAFNATSKQFSAKGWRALPAPDDPAGIQDMVVLKAPPSASPSYAFLVAADATGLQFLSVQPDGTSPSPWSRLSNNGPHPSFTGAQGAQAKLALAPIRNRDWPDNPPAPALLELILVDAGGALWRGQISTAGKSVIWFDISTNKTAKQSVTPAAAYVDAAPGSGTRPAAVVAAVGTDGSTFVVRDDGTPNAWTLPLPSDYPDFSPLDAGPLLCLPRIVESGSQQPLIAALGKTSIGDKVAVFWQGEDPSQVDAFSLPLDGSSGGSSSAGGSSEPVGLLLPSATGLLATLITTSPAEQILRAELDRTTEHVNGFTLYDAVFIDSAQGTPTHADIDRNSSSPGRTFSLRRSTVIEFNKKKYFSLIRSAALAINSPVRLLARKQTRLAGTPASPTQLRLHVSDVQTAANDVLVINRKSYQVVNVGSDANGKYADLQQSLPTPLAATVSYITTAVLTDAAAGTGNLGRFAELPSPRRAQLFNAKSGSSQVSLAVLGSKNNFLLLGEWPSATVLPVTDADIGTGLTIADLGLVQRRGYQNPELSWEYFDGRGWERIVVQDSTYNLAISGEVKFTVPDDLSQTDVAGQQDLWVRARLSGGTYGRAKYIVTTQPISGGTQQTITVDTSDLHPPEIQSISAAFQLDDAVPPQAVLVDNNGGVLNQTQAAAEPNAQFELFEGLLALDRPAADTALAGRVLFLGFSKNFNVDPLTLYADAEEQEGSGALQAEVLTATGWRDLITQDETVGFRRRGFVHISSEQEPVRVSLFGQELYWLRLRLKPVAGAPAQEWKPRINGLYVNAVMADQAKTIQQELLGSSDGSPDQTYALSNKPVIIPDATASDTPDVEIRVRETLSDDDRDVLRAAAGPDAVVNPPDIPGDWVRWQRSDTFIGESGDARIFKLDPAQGVITFGDGQNGKVPAAGRDSIRAFRYQQGGGIQGNVPAYAIKNLKSALDGVDSVANPVDAAGGIDAPGVDRLLATAPARLRHAGHALAAADMEAFAVSSSPDVIRARFVRARDAADKMRLAVVVRTGQPRPRPSLARAEALAKYLLAHAADILDADALQVVAPDYVPVTVAVRLSATSDDLISAVEDEAVKRIKAFLDPVDGGPDGEGWPFGRRVWPSDIYRLVSAIDGVDRIDPVDLKPEDSAADLDRLAPTAVICAAENGVAVHVQPGAGP